MQLEAAGEAPARLGCRFSTLTAGLRAECGVGLTGLASHKEAQKHQEQKKAELEHGFPVQRISREESPYSF